MSTIAGAARAARRAGGGAPRRSRRHRGPRVGWSASTSADAAVEHARQDHLLHVAAREQADRGVGAGAADVVGGDGIPRLPRAGTLEAQEAEALDTAASSRVSRARFSATDERADDALVVAVFGNAPDAGAHRRVRPSHRAARRKAGGAAAWRPRRAGEKRCKRRSGRCRRRRRCRRSRLRAPRARRGRGRRGRRSPAMTTSFRHQHRGARRPRLAAALRAPRGRP